MISFCRADAVQSKIREHERQSASISLSIYLSIYLAVNCAINEVYASTVCERRGQVVEFSTRNLCKYHSTENRRISKIYRHQISFKKLY